MKEKWTEKINRRGKNKIENRVEWKDLDTGYEGEGEGGREESGREGGEGSGGREKGN